MDLYENQQIADHINKYPLLVNCVDMDKCESEKLLEFIRENCGDQVNLPSDGALFFQVTDKETILMLELFASKPIHFIDMRRILP